jgi:glutamyl/glutaminyl-tRNA synthetase
MKITHVIRGDDHISNTPRQVHLYRALGYALPKFAHLPMILGNDRTRLSKRHGATSIDYYRERHYLPDAMVNYIALLGWSYNASSELFTRKALIEKFSLKRVSHNPAMFDTEKMEWINAEHFKMLPLSRKTRLLYAVLEERGLLPPDFTVDLTRPVDLRLVSGTEPINNGQPGEGGAVDRREFERLSLIIEVMGNRLKLLKDAPDIMRYFLSDEYPRDENAVRTHLMRTEAAERLTRLADEYEKLRYFDREHAEEALRGLADAMGIEAGELIHPCRVALTGMNVSPDIFWVIVLIGKAKTVERLRAAAKLSQ